MRIAFSVLVILAMIGTGCGRGNKRPQAAAPTQEQVTDTQSWHTVVSADDTYKASMPGKPKPVSRTINSPQGQIHIHMQEVHAKYGTYTVGLTQYPAAFLSSSDAKAELMFDQARDATAQQLRAKVTRDTKGTKGGFPCRTLTMEFTMPRTTGTTTMHQQLIFAKGRMYIVQSMILPNAPQSAIDNALRFHNSFTLNV